MKFQSHWLLCFVIQITALIQIEGTSAGNETVNAAADATADGEESEVNGQNTEILDIDGSVLVKSDVNGTGWGAGGSSATVNAEGDYEGDGGSKNALGVVAIESVGDQTDSMGKSLVAIEKRPKGNGDFDWFHILTSNSKGVAQGTGLSSSLGTVEALWESNFDNLLDRIRLSGENAALGDGDISSRAETSSNVIITPDGINATAQGIGEAMGQNSANALGGANLTLEENGESKDLEGYGEAVVTQNGRSANSAAAAGGEGKVDMLFGRTQTDGQGVGSVNNEDDGISSMEIKGRVKDGDTRTATASLDVETKGGGDAGSVSADGSARAGTFDIDCVARPDDICCVNGQPDPNCDPQPGVQGNIDKQVVVKGQNQMIKSAGNLNLNNDDGLTVLLGTNLLNATGNIDTIVNSSMTQTMDTMGQTEMILENRGEAAATGGESGIDITSSTGLDSEPTGESEITDALAKARAIGGDSKTAADTYTNVKGGRTTLGGSGATGKAAGSDLSGVTTETEFVDAKLPQNFQRLYANSENMAEGDATSVEASSRSDKVADSGVAISESTAHGKGQGASSLSIRSSAGRERVKRSVEEFRPQQPRLVRQGLRTAVCIGKRCFFAAEAESGDGAQLLTLADLVKAFGLKVARIMDLSQKTRRQPSLDEMFVYAPNE